MLSTRGPNMTRIFFADDLLLFGSDDDGTAACMEKVLEDLCDSSGMRISAHKTSILSIIIQ